MQHENLESSRPSLMQHENWKCSRPSLMLRENMGGLNSRN